MKSGCCTCVVGLELREETFGGAVHYGVFCGRDEVIPRKTRYGPFCGKVVNTSEIKTNDDNSFMWEVYEPTTSDGDLIIGLCIL